MKLLFPRWMTEKPDDWAMPLIAARKALKDAESALRDRRYSEARESLENAAGHASEAWEWTAGAAGVREAIMSNEWKFVPVEPTWQMWDQAENASMAFDDMTDEELRAAGAFDFPTRRIAHIVHCYRAMVAAAPLREIHEPRYPDERA